MTIASLQSLLRLPSLIPTAILLSALSIISLNASAQYLWLDENGTKQYSDMAPPITIPKERILKIPVVKKTDPVEPVKSASASASAAASAHASGPMTTAEKETDFQKRKIEQAEVDKKNAEEQKQAADKKRNCEKIKTYQQALDSGQRITRLNKNGERGYLDDEQRAKEAQENKAALSDCN